MANRHTGMAMYTTLQHLQQVKLKPDQAPLRPPDTPCQTLYHPCAGPLIAHSKVPAVFEAHCMQAGRMTGTVKLLVTVKQGGDLHLGGNSFISRGAEAATMGGDRNCSTSASLRGSRLTDQYREDTDRKLQSPRSTRNSRLQGTAKCTHDAYKVDDIGAGLQRLRSWSSLSSKTAISGYSRGAPQGVNVQLHPVQVMTATCTAALFAQRTDTREGHWYHGTAQYEKAPCEDYFKDREAVRTCASQLTDWLGLAVLSQRLGDTWLVAVRGRCGAWCSVALH